MSFLSLKQAPYPAVGVITSFVDELHAQAVVRYGGGRVVDRPLALLVKLVPATEQILEKGVLFDPFIQGDIELEQEQEQEQAQGVLQEQEQEQEKVAQVPQQQEPVAQQEDAAVQHGLGGHGDPEQGSASGQLADAPEGGGALSAVSQPDTPRPPLQGGKGGELWAQPGPPQ